MVHKERFALFYQRKKSYQPFFDGFGYIWTNVGKLCLIYIVFFETPYNKWTKRKVCYVLSNKQILSTMLLLYQINESHQPSFDRFDYMSTSVGKLCLIFIFSSKPIKKWFVRKGSPRFITEKNLMNHFLMGSALVEQMLANFVWFTLFSSKHLKT